MLDTSFSQTEILKWYNGKDGCVNITFDDGSENQFKIALPMLNERNFDATFFVNTENIEGSKYAPLFIGRPLEEIISESGTISTNMENVLERSSALRYLQMGNKNPVIKGFSEMEIGESLEQGKYPTAFETIDDSFSKIRNTKYKIEYEKSSTRIREGFRLSWDYLKILASDGHEIANHTISHPYLPALDEANILYEVEKCREDIQTHLGFKHTLSIECPYGIENARVLDIVNPKFVFVRNRITEPYIKEILRGDEQKPVSENKEYVQWQRGPLSKTKTNDMFGWVDETIKENVWLLLVFHGIEGIGWEALTKETIEEYFDYIKAHEDNLWITTYQNSFKYVRERMNSKVSESKEGGNIVIMLKNELDQNIYDLPLTLSTEVPNAWEKITVEQDGNSIEHSSINSESGNFIKYSIMPNSGVVRIYNAE